MNISELSSHFRILKGTTFLQFVGACQPSVHPFVHRPGQRLQGDNFNTYDMDPDSQKCRELTA